MRRPVGGIAAALAGLVVFAAALPALAAGSVDYQTVSLDVNGDPSAFRNYSYYGNTQVFAPYSLSSDGSSVAFVKRNGSPADDGYVPMAPNEFCNNNGGCRDIYVHNRATGRSVAATQFTEWSGDPSSGPLTGFGGDWGISADHTKFVQPWNCFDEVTFGDGSVCTKEFALVWVDMTTGETVVLDRRADGDLAGNGGLFDSMSADGDTVVFRVSNLGVARGDQCLLWDCMNLHPEERNRGTGIFVWRRGKGVEWITDDSAVFPANGFGDLSISPPRLSGDGRYMFFTVGAVDFNTVPEEVNNWVIRHELETGISEVMATASADEQFGAVAPNHDGSRVVVATWSRLFGGADGLYFIDKSSGDPNTFFDLGEGSCGRISITPDGAAAACDRNNFGPPAIVDLSTGEVHDFATAADGFGEGGYIGPSIGADGVTAVWAGQRLSDPDHVLGALQVRVATLTDGPGPGPDFVDVPADSWMTEPIRWLKESNLTTGCSPTHFCPDLEMPREQLVTFLHRYAGSPAPTSINPFIDVPRGRFFTTPIDWAYETGLTTGISPTLFGTGQPVTRAQVVTFLWRDAGRPNVGIPSGFPDVEPNRYYTLAVDWAKKTGVTTGFPDGTFRPNDPVTRAQFAAFLQRYDAL